jgi:cytoplasmic iron level regulating protein YaaA (DUF328/UPF0246 family)
MMKKTVALVACVQKKSDAPMPAGSLHHSTWFKKAAQYANQTADEWFILSPKYGLLSPYKVMPPYNESIYQMSVRERKAWAKHVAADLSELLSPGDLVVILAGERYREFILEPLKLMGCQVEIPMAGMKIGTQLNWLNTHLE